jgi:hypothetical protein
MDRAPVTPTAGTVTALTGAAAPVPVSRANPVPDALSGIEP